MPKLRVLIVDDSVTIRAILEEVLQKERCEIVGSAASIEEARQMIAIYAPDVITLDLAMPDCDGMSFLDERSAISHAPFVVISSSTVADSAMRHEALRRGAIACFDKSRLSVEGGKLAQALKLAAVQHLRARLARLEQSLGMVQMV